MTDEMMTPVPRLDHDCNALAVYHKTATGEWLRCPCGAYTEDLVVRSEERWLGKNSARKSLAFYYTDEDMPHLARLNRSLLTADGIWELTKLVERTPNLAELIVETMDTDRARRNFARGVDEELNARCMAECRESLRLAGAAGAAVLMVRRGLTDELKMSASITNDFCTMIVDLPLLDLGDISEDGRCLP